MTTWISPDWPIGLALNTLFTTDGTLAPMLQGNKVYSGTGEQGRPVPHIAIGDSNVFGTHQFGKRGDTTVATILVVGANKYDCALVVNECYRLLDGQELSLSNHVMVRGALAQLLATDGPDLTDYQVVLEYTVLSTRGTP